MADEDKLDTILQPLEGLSTDMQKLHVEMEGVKSEVAAVRQTVDDIEASIDRKLDAFKETINNHVVSEVNKAKAELKDSIKSDVSQAVQDKIESINVGDLLNKQQEMQKELDSLRALMDRPFHPDRSVVVYGFNAKENETIDDQVNRLLYQTLEVVCVPKFYERVENRNADKPGVLKIEFKNTFDKDNSAEGEA